MKVLIADKFEQSGIDGLRAAACEVVYQPELKADAIRESHADVLVVRGTGVTAQTLEAGSLSLVVRAGAGYNTIDVVAASKRGIYVSNCPGRNAIAVAELACALMLALDRRLPDNVNELRAGRWNKKEFSKARGLYGRTLGLLGYGNIGQEMAKRAHALGMSIVVWSRRFVSGQERVEDAQVPMALARTPQEVAEQCDVLSVHLALTPDTRGLVDASVLERLKPGSYFINTARGECVDYHALERVIKDRHIRVALDVFAVEPKETTGPRRPFVSSPPTRIPARCRTSSTWPRQRRRRTCLWSGTTTVPGFSRTSSITCARATSTFRKRKMSFLKERRLLSPALIWTAHRRRRC